MRFVKMHGIGNDYLFLDALAEPAILLRRDLPDLARKMTNRRTGVGSDGLIIVAAPDRGVQADLTMRILNADGSEGGICGNGARCAAKLAVERGYVTPGPSGALTIAADQRLLSVRVSLDSAGVVQSVTIDMGRPNFDLSAVGVDPRGVEVHFEGGQPATAQYRVGSRVATFVSMGNPHMVAFIDEPVETVRLDHEGPMFEHHPAFSQRINYHIANRLSPSAVVVRTWERGSGITHGCGSGACAVLAAGVRTGITDHAVRVHMIGGDLDMACDMATGHILMTGPAVEVFQGEWPLADNHGFHADSLP